MVLTRDRRRTILECAQNDARFREALFTEAINAYLAGDTSAGKATLRDLVNATIGFEGLAAEINKPSKSLHRMLAPHGNPGTENFFGIVSVLQKKTRVTLRVTAMAAQSKSTKLLLHTAGPTRMPRKLCIRIEKRCVNMCRM